MSLPAAPCRRVDPPASRSQARRIRVLVGELDHLLVHVDRLHRLVQMDVPALLGVSEHALELLVELAGAALEPGT